MQGILTSRLQKMKKKPSKLKRIVRDPNGPFRMRVVSDKKKYTRKIKHKNKEDA